MSEKSTKVEVTFTPEGEVIPRRFQWQARSLTVEGVGRRWSEGGQRCFNVMAMGGRLFELRFNPATCRWTITRGPIPGLAA
jgi:hypothetical protein